MGIQRNQYIIYGVSLDPELYTEDMDEVLEPFYDSAFSKGPSREDKMVFLYDGLSGEYFIIGYCIAKGRENDYLGIIELKEPSKAIKKHIETTIRELIGFAPMMKLMFVDHYR